MEWLPIEIYDKKKIKPQWCVFYVAPQVPVGKENKGNHLSEMLSFTRYLGYRNITMFCVMPPPPKVK